MSKYYPPTYKSNQFHCLHCGVFAAQDWALLFARNISGKVWSQSIRVDHMDVETSICSHCGNPTFWLNEKIIYPPSRAAPPANSDLPDIVKKTYEEAASIASQSSRAASALLRLAFKCFLNTLVQQEILTLT